MLYRIIHAINESFALAVFWLYVAAMILGLGTIFVFPQAAVVLVFLGLLCLGPAIIGSKILAAIDRALARQILRQGACPHCGQFSEPRPDPGAPWRCPNCHAAFEASGACAVELVDNAPVG